MEADRLVSRYQICHVEAAAPCNGAGGEVCCVCYLLLLRNADPIIKRDDVQSDEQMVQQVKFGGIVSGCGSEPVVVGAQQVQTRYDV